MGIRLTTEDWVAKAKAIWGDQYLYDRVNYVDSRTPVIVCCPEHGPWPCNPSNHARKKNKRGCPVCGGSQKKTTEQFIWEATRIHQGCYDYTDTEYTRAKDLVQIRCPTHGIFAQEASSHLSGSGCGKCADEDHGRETLLAESEVQSRLAVRCQGWESNVALIPGSYKGMNEQFQVTCSVHGAQEPRLGTSIFSSPHPCIECSGTGSARGHTTESFKELIIDKFGERYVVDSFTYEGPETVITFHCAIHGVFKLQAASVNRSPGCNRCAYDSSREKRAQGQRRNAGSSREMRKAEWLQKAQEKHGDFFIYDNVVYVNQKTPVAIECPIHGQITQKPYDHLQGGCRKCADSELAGLYSERFFELRPEAEYQPAMLYYIQFLWKREKFFKVGITTTTVEKRFNAIRKGTVELKILGQAVYGLKDAWSIEQKIQADFGEKSRYNPQLIGLPHSIRDLRIGPSECFLEPLLPAIMKRYFES